MKTRRVAKAEGGVAGRPSLAVTEKQRGQVKKMAALGMSQDEVAVLVGVAAKTLRKHFRSELDRGALEANAAVMESLFRMATSGKNTAATIFWVKTRCGLRERPAQSEEGVPAMVVGLGEEL